MIKIVISIYLLFVAVWGIAIENSTETEQPSGDMYTTTVSPEPIIQEEEENDEVIHFVLSAINLDGPSVEHDGYADAYVKVYLGEERDSGGYHDLSSCEFLGETKCIDDDNSPDWPDVFTIRRKPGSRQVLVLKIFDHDLLVKDDYMGKAYMTVEDILNNDYGRVIKHILGNFKRDSRIVLRRADPFKFLLRLDNKSGKARNVFVKGFLKFEHHHHDDAHSDCNCDHGHARKTNEKHYLGKSEVMHCLKSAHFSVPFRPYVRGSKQVVIFQVFEVQKSLILENLFFNGDHDERKLGEAVFNVDEFLEGRRNVTFDPPEQLRLTISASDLY